MRSGMKTDRCGVGLQLFSRKAVLKMAGSILIAGFLIVILIRYDLIQLELLKKLFFRPWLLLGIVIIEWFSVPLCALRWWWLIRDQRIDIGFWDTTRVLYLSNLFGFFLPGVVGSDLLRVVLSSRITNDHQSEFFVTVMMDRLLGVIGLLMTCILASIGLMYVRNMSKDSLNLLILFALLLAVSVALMLGFWRFARYLRKFSESHAWSARSKPLQILAHMLTVFEHYRYRYGLLFKTAAFSTLIHSKDVAVIVYIGLLINIGHGQVFLMVFAASVSLLSNMIPITPQGIGVGETIFTNISRWLSTAQTTTGYGSIVLMKRVLNALSLIPASFLLFSLSPSKNRF